MKVLYATALILMSFHVSANQNPHVNDFINIFKKHCFAFKNNPDAAGTFLESRGYKRNPEFQDAYEILVGNIDYAVTPQHYDCTADVLVMHTGKRLFGYNELNSALKRTFGLTEINNRIFQDVALDNKNTKIQQTDYSGRGGHRFRLLYPKTNQNNYYMTFTIDWLR